MVADFFVLGLDNDEAPGARVDLTRFVLPNPQNAVMERTFGIIDELREGGARFDRDAVLTFRMNPTADARGEVTVTVKHGPEHRRRDFGVGFAIVGPPDTGARTLHFVIPKERLPGTERITVTLERTAGSVHFDDFVLWYQR
jgi:hypothetical protein